MEFISPLLASHYTQAQIDEYAETGNPTVLNGFFIPIESRGMWQTELSK
jgi:hypothetical protein